MDGAIRLSVSGVVQGVGFRYFVKRSADALGLVGWVQNESDGTVSCEAEGDEGMLQEFVTLVRIGNSPSTVSGVKEQNLEWSGQYTSFEIRF